MLPSHQLEAFVAVARAMHFTKAAKRIGLTQPALSQRIANLESTLALTLFVRDRSGVRLTEAGERLLHYCRAQEELESTMLAALRPTAPGELTGTLRVAAFSSVLRSLVLPSLAALIRTSPRVQIELTSREMRQLPELLRSGDADLVVVDRELAVPGLDAIDLGTELNVLVEPEDESARRAFLDHDVDDPTTVAFFRSQRGTKSSPPALERSYLDDIYGILDGVAAGLGRAVVSKHLLPWPGVKIVAGYRAMPSPIVLHRRAQPFYSPLHQAALGALVDGFAARLK